MATKKTTTTKKTTSKLNTSSSIVDKLKSEGKDSSFAARAKLAESAGIKNYTGSAAQNQQLLSASSKSSPAPSNQKTSSSSSSSSSSSKSPAPAPSVGSKSSPTATFNSKSTSSPSTPKSSYGGGSVVDYLKSAGSDSSFANRSALAAQYGIRGYTGSAQQNIDLLSKLRSAGADTSPVKNADPVNQYLNEDQEGVKAEAEKTNEPPTRSPYTLDMPQDKNLLDEKPVAPSFEKEYGKLKSKYKIEELEDDLASLEKEYEDIAARKRQRVAAQGDKGVALNVVEGRVGEVERQENERLDAVQREMEYTSSQLKTRYGIIDTMIKLKDTDYDNARQEYADQFSRTMTVLNYNKAVENDIKDEAKANLQIVYNAVQNGGANIDDLSEAEKANIAKLEVQSGMPVGFLRILQSKNPKADIISSSTRQDASGRKYADMVLRDKDGKFTVQSVYIGQERLPSSGGGGSNNQSEWEFEASARSKVTKFFSSVKGQDGYVSPDDFKKAREAAAIDGFSSDDFNKEFRNYANPQSYRTVGLPLVP